MNLLKLSKILLICTLLLRTSLVMPSYELFNSFVDSCKTMFNNPIVQTVAIISLTCSLIYCFHKADEAVHKIIFDTKSSTDATKLKKKQLKSHLISILTTCASNPQFNQNDYPDVYSKLSAYIKPSKQFDLLNNIGEIDRLLRAQNPQDIQKLTQLINNTADLLHVAHPY
jgi:hypothetical protein